MSAYLTDHATGAVYELAGDYTVSTTPPQATVAVPTATEAPATTEETAATDQGESTEEAAGATSPLPEPVEEATLEVGTHDPSLSLQGQPNQPARM